MRRILAASMLVLSTGCATSYRPADTGPSAFAFTLTPEQCEHLRSEARGYRSTEKTGEYVGTSTALVGAALLLIPATRNATTAQGAAALVGLVAGGTSVFTASQVTDLEAEIEAGGCR